MRAQRLIAILALVCLPAPALADGGDHLYLLSGGQGDPPPLLWSIRPQSGLSDGGGYGDACLETCPDLSGDGFPDVLLGTAWGNRSVHAVDGRTGALLWTFASYLQTSWGWVYDVSWIADRTGDGLPEVACALGSDANCGYLLSGADLTAVPPLASASGSALLETAGGVASGPGLASGSAASRLGGGRRSGPAAPGGTLPDRTARRRGDPTPARRAAQVGALLTLPSAPA